jgi:NAD(P)H-hydrate epimerase
VVLKGANTAILAPDGVIYFNSTGNTGLAKAGTGDVLTGMITSMIAQGYDQLTGVKRAVFLHGQCAEDLGENRQLYSFLASDLIDQIGKGKI